MIALAIDAATYIGSVALWRGDTLVAEQEAAMRGAEHERLMPAVASMLESAGADVAEIGRIYCGAGPGSFTSLRIAASICKGVAVGRGGELWSVPSLGLTVAGARPALPAGRYFSVLDALRGECHGALYEVAADGVLSELEPARLVPAAEVDAIAARLEASVIGPGRVLDHPPRARGARLLVASGGARRVDLDSWEPEYGRLAEAQVKWEAAHGRPLPRA